MEIEGVDDETGELLDKYEEVQKRLSEKKLMLGLFTFQQVCIEIAPSR